VIITVRVSRDDDVAVQLGMPLIAVVGADDILQSAVGFENDLTRL